MCLSQSSFLVRTEEPGRQRPVPCADRSCNSQVHCVCQLFCLAASKFHPDGASRPRCAEGSCGSLRPPENTNPVNPCGKPLAAQIFQQSPEFPALENLQSGIMPWQVFPDSKHEAHRIDPCFYQPHAITYSQLPPSECAHNALSP